MECLIYNTVAIRHRHPLSTHRIEIPAAQQLKKRKKEKSFRLGSPRLAHLSPADPFCHSRRVESFWKFRQCALVWPSWQHHSQSAAAAAAVSSIGAIRDRISTERDGVTDESTRENIYNMEKAYFIFFFFGIFNLRSRILRVILLPFGTVRNA